MKILSNGARYCELIALITGLDIKPDAILLTETRFTDATEDSKRYQIFDCLCFIVGNRKTREGNSIFLKMILVPAEIQY